MKVRDLKKFLEDISDDAEVVGPDFDHSYRQIRRPSIAKAESNNGHLSEHYPEYAEDGVKVIDVVVFV